MKYSKSQTFTILKFKTQIQIQLVFGFWFWITENYDLNKKNFSCKKFNKRLFPIAKFSFFCFNSLKY